MTRSGSLRTFLCCGEDGGGSRSPVVPASGRVELPVTEFGVHRPREFLGRDDFAVVWKLREDTTDCYFPRAWAERKRRLQRAPDIARVLIGRPPARRAARASSATAQTRIVVRMRSGPESLRFQSQSALGLRFGRSRQAGPVAPDSPEPPSDRTRSCHGAAPAPNGPGHAAAAACVRMGALGAALLDSTARPEENAATQPPRARVT
jgi:hypothetical protein